MKKLLSSAIIISVILLSLCSCVKNHREDTDSSMVNTVSSENTTSDESKQNEYEPKSVPDSLVLENVTVSENEKYEISHNYDKSNKVDYVTLIVNYNGKFGTHIKKYCYQYQYDTSNDLWSEFDGENGLLSDEITYNEEAYKSFGHFTGRFSRYETGTYDITIQSLDFAAKTATVNYCLTFDRDSEQIRGENTVEIVQGNSSDLWAIIIEYNRSMVVRFDQAFVLDMDKGLYAYE